MLKSDFVEIVLGDLCSLTGLVHLMLDLSVTAQIDGSVFFCLLGLNLVVLGLGGQLVDQVLQSSDGLPVLFRLVDNFLEATVELSLGFGDFSGFLERY